MVSFVCDACGQTVKKQKVEKHYQNECRNCNVLSCIDCGKDFPGDSYASHTSCISEAEKYQGKLFRTKDKENKGDRKQQEWLEQVRSAPSETGNQDPRVRKLMSKIVAYDNVPRKEAKFKNFCQNSINVRDKHLLDKLWQAFSGAKKSNASSGMSNESHDVKKQDGTVIENNNDCNTHNLETEDGILQLEGENKVDERKGSREKTKKQKRKHRADAKEEETMDRILHQCDISQVNGEERKLEEAQEVVAGEMEKSCRKKKKRKHQEDEVQENGIEKEKSENSQKKQKSQNEPDNAKCCSEQDEVGNEEQKAEAKEKFKWEVVIKKVLKSAPNKEMSVKKLRKKVLNEFLAQGGESRPRTDAELRTLFDRKLHKNPKIQVNKERAKYGK